MARNNYQLLSTITLAASGMANDSAVVEFDLRDIADLQFGIGVDYAATDAITGVSLVMKSGFGPSPTESEITLLDGRWWIVDLGGSGQLTTPNYDSLGETKTLRTVQSSSGSPISTLTPLDTIIDTIPRYLKMEFQNTDSVNSATITIHADL